MEKPILLTITITVVYFLVKYIEKESKPVKLIIRDLIIVFLSAFVPIFLFFSATGPVAEMIGGGDFTTTAVPTQIFTDLPGF